MSRMTSHESAAIERAAEVLGDYVFASVETRRVIAARVLNAAAPPPRYKVTRFHWPNPRWEGRPTCNPMGRYHELTDDPALVTCGHCKKYLREMAA